jgi:hypothetical protein
MGAMDGMRDLQIRWSSMLLIRKLKLRGIWMAGGIMWRWPKKIGNKFSKTFYRNFKELMLKWRGKNRVKGFRIFPKIDMLSIVKNSI